MSRVSVWLKSLMAGLIAGVIGFASTGVCAVVLPNGNSSVTPGPTAEGVTEYRFANGFKLLLLPDDSRPTVTVSITYRVGSSHENYGETGMAHLLEHLMFKGTPRYPAIPQEFKQRGMQFNGTTALERTNYYEFFQANDDNLQWAITMEADRMLHSNIAKNDLETEMTVVRNEFESGENSPAGVMFKRMQAVAYDWHNYGKPTIGNRSDIENIKIENLQAFYRTYYQPDNAVLLIAGQFDQAKALAWVDNNFGAMPKPSRKLPQFWTVEPAQDGERSFAVRRAGDVQLIWVAYKMPSKLHTDAIALAYAGAILADTPHGVLYKKLVESGRASAVTHGQLSGYAPGLQLIVAAVKKGQPIEPARDALIAAIESFAATPPTAEQIERVRRSNANNFENLMSDPQRLGLALSDAIALGDWRLLFAHRELADKMTAQQVANAAATYFRRDNRTVGMFLPEDQPRRAAVPAAPDIAGILAAYTPRQAIDSGEAFDPSPANIDRRTQHAQLGGLALALMPKKTRGNTVSVRLQLHWGDEKNLFGKKAVSTLTSDMLTRGTTGMRRAQLADEFSRLKMSGGIYSFQTTRDNVGNALQLVADVLRYPRFDPAEFEQLRQQSLAAIEVARNDPSSRAAEVLAQHFNHYPDGDWRAAQTADEQTAAIKAVTLDDVKAFHRDFYGASHGELAIVGDFDVAAVVDAAQTGFFDWKSTVPYQRVLSDYVDIAAARQVINTPDKENGVYLARLNLPLRDSDPDYPALVVANYLIGGGSMKSRLADRVRQKDGMSYSISSSLNVGAISPAGHFDIHAIAAPQNLDKVDAAIKEELHRVVREGFSRDEMMAAKSGILKRHSQDRAQDSNLSNGWAALLNLDRSYAWQQTLDDKIQALTLEQLNAALRKAIDPARLSVVIVRDESKAAAK